MALNVELSKHQHTASIRATQHMDKKIHPDQVAFAF